MPAHALLLTVAELPQYALSGEFLDQFIPRSLEVRVSTAGALGVMAISWRRVGESDYSAPIASQASAPWALRLSDGYADVSFPAGTYVLDAVYTIAENGTVTNTGGGPTVTATRFDLRTSTCQAITDEVIGRMKPAVVPPILQWGSDIRLNVGKIVAYELKSLKGLAPTEAEAGDGNLLVRATQARAWFDAVGKGLEPSDPFQDSSGATSGLSGTFLSVQSDDPFGWC